MSISESILYNAFKKEKNNVFISEKALKELYNKKFRFVYDSEHKEIYLLMDDEENAIKKSDHSQDIKICEENLFKELNDDKNKLITEVPRGSYIVKNEKTNTIKCVNPIKNSQNPNTVKWIQDNSGRWIKAPNQ